MCTENNGDLPNKRPTDSDFALPEQPLPRGAGRGTPFRMEGMNMPQVFFWFGFICCANKQKRKPSDVIANWLNMRAKAQSEPQQSQEQQQQQQQQQQQPQTSKEDQI